MILNIFPQVGDTLSIACAYSRLISLYNGQAYPENKAAGSLGGSVANGVPVATHYQLNERRYRANPLNPLAIRI